MKKALFLTAVCLFISGVSFADTFAAGTANEFTIDFLDISGDASSANGTFIGDDKPEGFIDPGYDYRIGTYEITYDQWNKFNAQLGVPVTGSPSSAYDYIAFPINDGGTNVPAGGVSWYEAAQFVNWLNTSTGHQAAYKFSGIQGTSGYTLQVWQSGDNGYDASNPYRNSNAYYFLPTEDEWVKAAYWNGTNLQTYATVDDVTPTQNGWNFFDNDYATDPYGPWAVGSGSEELNGTYDMMGNVWEWMESPYYSGNYLSGSVRSLRGGSYDYVGWGFGPLRSDARGFINPDYETFRSGFRLASVPEPCSLVLLSLGGLLIRKRK